MNREYLFFINVLSDHIAGDDTIASDNLNWDEISRLAHIHQVEGILYSQCRAFMPEIIVEEYEERYLQTMYKYINRKKLMNQVDSVLNEYDLKHFTVKGFEVAKYYPYPALRTMSDCDIVVHRNDFKQIVSLLKNIGFVGNAIASTEQWGGKKNGFYFEIHDRLVQEGEYASNKQAAFFNNFDSYVNDGRLDVSFHFLFLLMHLRKHFLNHGVGIRQFMDLAVISKSGADLRWDWIEERLTELGLLKFAHVCYSLIDSWFGIIIPVEKDMLPDDFTIQVTEKILRNGVFGFDDKENKMANAHTALLKASGPMWMKRLIVLFQNVFLSYEVMRSYPDCGFLDGKPWLLSVAWCKRLVGIFTRANKTKTIGVVRNSFISTEELDDRRKLLDRMGLL